jgi:hypothetical protein
MKRNLLLLLISVLIGCNSNSIVKYQSNNCNTIVEGSYTYNKIWNTYAPAIVFKKGVSVKFGTVIKQDDKNIVFVETKRRASDNPDTLIYPVNTIRTIIDSAGNCVYGDIPGMFCTKVISLRVYLDRENGSLKENLYWDMEPNENFAYCMKPGKYTINRIEFYSAYGEDESISIPFSAINVDSNKTNYIGNIILCSASSTKQNIYKVPFKTVSDKKQVGATATFGLLGGLLYGLSKSTSADSSKYYALVIKNDSTFSPSSKQKNVENIIH